VRRRGLFLFVLLVLGLSASTRPVPCFAAAPPDQAAAPAPAPPQLRLPSGVHPARYAVNLTLSPESEDFSGTIDIEIASDVPQPVLWLNARNLVVSEASVKTAAATLHPRIVPGGDDFVGLAFEKPVEPGRMTAHVAYTGTASAKDLDGIFRQKEGDDWYVFTQFEAIGARKAFPCFDEPAYKVPWQISLKVKKEMVAVSNAPIASETDAADGMKIVRFAETKPLPSYLVALGVGPFDIAEGPPVGSKSAPFRVLVPKGQKPQAAFTVQSTPQLVTLLEKYFGTPYPYEKLDFLAIPLAGWAMENAGLITYGHDIILVKPEDETPDRQREFGVVAAHELAHMWFGDLVTMKWWDDIWLNESFASWMESKIVEQWKPDWDIPVGRVEERYRAIAADRLISARQIRQPIESDDDIENAFDGITYAKGSAVITMLERWVGPERFQRGVQQHLAAHAWGNADAADFFASLSAEAGKDVGPVFSTFLNQSGVPLVTAAITCSKGSPPSLKLTQKRFLPLGSTGSEERTWKVPVCVRYGVAGDTIRQCTLLEERSGEIRLSEAKACPDWLLPNDQASGYYVSKIEPAGSSARSRPGGLASLLDDSGKRLTEAEAAGVLSDLNALASAGVIPLPDVLAKIPKVVRDGNRHSIEIAGRIVGSLGLNLVPENLLPNYQRFVRKTFGEKARALGWSGSPGEPEDTKLLRPYIVALVAQRGEDTDLQKQARALAARYLTDHGAVPAEMVEPALTSAAWRGDQAWFDAVHAAARKEKDRSERRQLLEAMASFHDPAIVEQRLALLLTDEFDPREALALLGDPRREPTSLQKSYEFLKTNYDAIADRIPKEYARYLAAGAGAFCDEAHRLDVEKFFKERMAKAPGGPRILAQTLEQIQLCTARKQAQQAGLAAFLQSQ